MVYKFKDEQKRQGWDLVVTAWTIANITNPAHEVFHCTTRDGAGGEVWINPKLGPRRAALYSYAQR